MTAALLEAEKLLSNMNRAEKAQLLQWVASDLSESFPGITSTPGVCGGEPCIVRTRIPVWVLANYRRLGAPDAEILRSYPSLTRADLEAAWEYAAANPAEIDEAIRENEAGEEGFVE